MERTIFENYRDKKAMKRKAAANSPFRAFGEVNRLYLNNARVLYWHMGYILQRLEKETERITAIFYTRLNGVSVLRIELRPNLKKVGFLK